MQLSVRKHYFRNTFFLLTFIEWNKLDRKIQIFECIGIFKKSILTFIQPIANNVLNCHNPRVLKLLSRQELGLIHLHEHKFKRSFQNSLNPFCICKIGEIKTCCHYLFHCSNYPNERLVLLNSIKNIDSSVLHKTLQT